MKKNTTKPSAIIFLILLSTSIFANKTPNYPKGFSPKTNNGISFTENKGQIHDQNYKSRPDVLFGGSDGNLVFHLKNNGISYQLNRVDTWKKESDLIKNNADAKIQKDDEKLVADQTTIYRLDINWLNANTNAELKKQNPLDGFNNYYSENCPNGALNVKSYQQITYQNIYDGIDLKWYEKDGHLEYDYLVSAGADYKQIQLEIKGADKITLNNKGELIYKTPLGDIIEQAPLVKQNGNTLKSKWIIKNNILSFEIENINKSQAFIIDPVVRLWGTYYGGSGDDIGRSCTTDASGNVYMAGETISNSGIATAGAHQTVYGGGNGGDPYLVKFNSSGVRQWGTYYTGYGIGFSCTTDASGNVYLAGRSVSLSGIATAGAHQAVFGGYADAFLVKFNSSGVRQWGTYYGGSGDETGFSCTTDASGNIYLAGFSVSLSGIATAGAHQTVIVGGSGAFLVKFNTSGVRQWGTYYGGNGNNEGNSCTTDASGNVYLAGLTTSQSDIITAGSHQTVYGGNNDAFLVKFNSSGVRQWGTYYGGTNMEQGNSCSTDASGNVYLAGLTDSNSGIATSGAHQTINGGAYDAFLVKFNSAGIRQWGTYYGATGAEMGSSSATDANGNVYLAGFTTSTIGISTAGSHQTVGSGGRDAFLVKFNSAGIRQWGTYYGIFSADERGISCTADASGNIYLAGFTDSNSGLASAGAHQTVSGGGISKDAFLVKFNDCLSPIITVNSGSICIGQSFTIIPTGANTYTIQGGSAVVSPTINTTYTVIGTSASGCQSDDFATSSLTINASPIISISGNTIICAGETATLIVSGGNTYQWSTGAGSNSITINQSPNIYNYTVTGTGTNSCTSIATIQVIINTCTGIEKIKTEGVSIYPNPNNGEFTIELVSINNTYITITNVLGQIIKTQKAELMNQIDLNAFDKGIYFINVMENNQSVYKGSIIKE